MKTTPTFFACVLVAGLLAIVPARSRAQPVDLALVLAVDVSSSVNWDEFALQMDGLSRAFREPEIWDAIASGPTGEVAVTLVQWAGPEMQSVSVDWTRIRDRDGALRFADAIASVPRSYHVGGTAIADVIAFATRRLQQASFETTRRVVDISGDGRATRGGLPPTERDAAVTAGITINGLAILNDEKDLDAYYASNVIGGVNAFIEKASGYEDFAAAIRRKLAREIRGQWLGVGLPPSDRREPEDRSGVLRTAAWGQSGRVMRNASSTTQ